jgi:hypothetical protein
MPNSDDTNPPSGEPASDAQSRMREILERKKAGQHGHGAGFPGGRPGGAGGGRGGGQFTPPPMKPGGRRGRG